MKQIWKGLSPTVKLVVIAVIIVVLFISIRRFSKWYKKKQAEKLLSQSTYEGDINGQPVSVNLGEKAQRIYDAFYDNDWFGWTEDEDAAIVALMDVPRQLVPQLSKIYFELYEKNLNADFIKYTGDDYNKVSYLFN